MLTGENGILNRAKEAKEKTELSQKEENTTLSNYEKIIDKYASNLPSTEYTEPYLPNSTFSYKEGNLGTGLVIKDSNNNEYVWIEVPTTIYNNEEYNSNGAKKPKNDEDYTNIEACLKAYTNDYTNSDYGDTNSSDSELYQNMLKSVYTNGGFWIGRYEAGYEVDESKGETAIDYNNDYYVEHPITKKVVIQKNKFPYNWMRREQAQELATGMNYDGCTSSLIFGVQWDLMIKYIEMKNPEQKDNLTTDSKSIGNYKNNLWNITNENAKYIIELGTTYKACPLKKEYESNVMLTTGADESFGLGNVYDIAGNMWEWTLEFYNDDKPWVSRGGSYFDLGSKYPAEYRLGREVNYSDRNIGFRVGVWK